MAETSDTPAKTPDPAAAQEVAGLLAHLASNLPEGAQKRQLTGPERAAILMLALGEEHGSRVWNLLDDEELRQISVVMSTIGTIEAGLVENLLLEFVSRMSASGAIMGNYEATERLLQQYLPPERVGNIMEEIRGPAGRNMWEKLSNVQEEVLANYLKNEYPQTVAVVLVEDQAGTCGARALHSAGGTGARCRQPHAAHGSRCRRRFSNASRARCAPNSCRTCRRPAAATRTR